MTEKMTYPEYSKNYPMLAKNLMQRPLTRYLDDIAMVYRNDEWVNQVRRIIDKNLTK